MNTETPAQTSNESHVDVLWLSEHCLNNGGSVLAIQTHIGFAARKWSSTLSRGTVTKFT